MNKQLFSKRVKLALSILVVCVSLVSFVASPFLVFAGDNPGYYDVIYGAYRLYYGEYVNIFVGTEGDSHTANLDEALFDQDELNFLMVYNLAPSTHVSKNYYQQGLDFTISFSTHVFSHGNGRNGLFDSTNLRDFSVVVYYADGTFNRLPFSYTFDVTNYNYRMSIDCYGFKNKDISNIQIRYYADYFELFEIPYVGSVLYMNSVSLDELYRYDSLSSDDILGNLDDKADEQLELTGNILTDIGLILSNIGGLPSKIGSALSGFFGSLKTSVDGVASKLWSYLSGPLSNILASISDNPEAVYNLFSGSLSDFLSKQDGILGGIGELPTKIGSALSGFFGSLETSVDGIGNDLWNYLAGPLSNILASISDNPEAIHNLFSGTLSEFLTKLDTEPDRIYSLFSGSLINMEDLMEKLLNPDSGIDHDFDQESSEAGEKLDQLAGDISVSKPDISDVETKVLTYTTASGIGQVAALFSIVTMNENVTAMLLAALSFGLMGLVFFGSKR